MGAIYGYENICTNMLKNLNKWNIEGEWFELTKG